MDFGDRRHHRPVLCHLVADMPWPRLQTVSKPSRVATTINGSRLFHHQSHGRRYLFPSLFFHSHVSDGYHLPLASKNRTGRIG